MENYFSKLNYYQMLDIKPEAAFFEIRHAYNAALQIYQAESLVSYSFFSREERREILALLEKAYLTLIDEKSRQVYDNELIGLGVIAEVKKKSIPKSPINIFDINRRSNAVVAKTPAAELRAKISENPDIGDILARNEITGGAFKEIRNKLAVELEKIAQETKVRVDYLRNIEEDNVSQLPADVFLKGFIKSYLKCLCLEPADELCARYMLTVAANRKKA
ncbi:MAG TPA: helix-turn-helix domain-containing protein [Smithellaceae bacterium]|nr:helix-turn-helix domain-containing protein [Smithellaceae bacterium]